MLEVISRVLAALYGREIPNAVTPLHTIIVTGGRDYDDIEFFFDFMDKLDKARGPIRCVRHGRAKGADILADRWAYARGREIDAHPAQWWDLEAPGAVIRYNSLKAPYNLLAGFQRNTAMAKKGADACIAFPGGDGTAHMVKEAGKYNIEVIEAK